jgi:hypothetical protein
MQILKLAFVFLISFSSIAGELFPDSKGRPYTIADTVEENLTIGGYPIWPGEKKWRILQIVDESSTGVIVPMGRAVFFQTENKKMVHAMQVNANLQQKASSDWTDEPCKREDFLFKASLGGKFSRINCVSINHIVGYPGNVSGKDAEAFAFFKAEGVDIPPTVIRVTFTRYDNNMRRYVVTLNINPEIVGFPRENEIVWGQNPWHKSQSYGNSDKKRFIDALSVWSVEFAKQMDGAFNKEKSSLAQIQSWRVAVDAGIKVINEKPKLSLD